MCLYDLLVILEIPLNEIKNTPIGDIIISIMIDNAAWIITYIFATILIIIIVIAKIINSRNKLNKWKTSTINIGVYKTTDERNDDWLLNSLWNENQRLEKEVKLLKKEYTKLSTSSGLFALIVLVLIFLKSKLPRMKRLE